MKWTATALTASLMLVAALPAWGADREKFLDRDPSRLFQDEAPDIAYTVAVLGRLSSLDGNVEGNADYDDLLENGDGFLIEGVAGWLAGPGLRVGPYLSIGFDRYDGDTFTDTAGITFEPDKLELITVMVGGKAQFLLGGGVHVTMGMVIGAAHYRSSDGTLTIGGTPSDVDMIDATTVFTFGGDLRLGYSVASFFVEIGVGVRNQEGPNSGIPNVEPGSLGTLAFEFGIGLRF